MTRTRVGTRAGYAGLQPGRRALVPRDGGRAREEARIGEVVVGRWHFALPHDVDVEAQGVLEQADPLPGGVEVEPDLGTRRCPHLDDEATVLVGPAAQAGHLLGVVPVEADGD